MQSRQLGFNDVEASTPSTRAHADSLAYKCECRSLRRSKRKQRSSECKRKETLTHHPCHERSNLFSRGRGDDFIEKVQSLQTNTGLECTVVAPTSPSDRAVVDPVSSPIGCVMIRSCQHASAGCQFLRELSETLSNDLVTKCGRPAHDHWTMSASSEQHTSDY